MKHVLMTSAAALALATPALADVDATATTDLNLRAGPGAWHEVLAVIPAGDPVTVKQCYHEANWCEVAHAGHTGWSYGTYLSTTVGADEASVLSPEAVEEKKLTMITVENTEDTSALVGAGWGALAGSLIAGPAGAAIGAAVATPAAVLADPGPQVTAYVEANPVDPVWLDGELMLGVGIPDAVEIYEIPVDDDDEFAYVNVNGTPVIVETDTRRVVTIVN